jgi:hypothetical protein
MTGASRPELRGNTALAAGLARRAKEEPSASALSAAPEPAPAAAPPAAAPPAAAPPPPAGGSAANLAFRNSVDPVPPNWISHNYPT